MNMKLRYRLFLRRKSVYYAFDDTTKTFTSLKTKDKAEANRLLMAMNEAGKQPAMNLSLARVYLRHSDPLVTTRTWSNVLDEIIAIKTGPTQARWKSAAKDKAFAPLLSRVLIETQAEHLLAVLRTGTVSTNAFLRKIHNFAVDMNWLPATVIPRRQWSRNPRRITTMFCGKAASAGTTPNTICCRGSIIFSPSSAAPMANLNSAPARSKRRAGRKLNCSNKLWRKSSGISLSPNSRNFAPASAEGIFQTLGLPTYPTQVALWDTYRSSPPPLNTLAGHTGAVLDANFQADGIHALSIGSDQTIKEWDDRFGLANSSSKLKTAGIACAVIARDGKHLIVGTVDGIFELWDQQTKQPVRAWRAPKGKILCVAISADSRLCASGSADGSIQCWDLTDGQEVGSFVAQQEVSCLAFSADDQWLLAGGDTDAATIWEVQTGKLLKTLTIHGTRMSTAVFSPDGKYALIGSDDPSPNGLGPMLALWDINACSVHRTFASPLAVITAVAFSPDGQRALSGSLDGTVKLWDIDDGRELQTFCGHRGLVSRVAFSADGRRALSAAADGLVQIWPVTNTGDLCLFKDGSEGVLSALSRDGRLALEADCRPDGWVRLWDTATGCELGRWKHSAGLYGLAISPDGRLSLEGQDNGIIVLRNLATGEILQSLTGHNGPIFDVTFNSDSTRGLSCGGDGTIRLWDLVKGVELRKIDIGPEIRSVRFSPDNQLAAAVNFKGTLIVWPLASDKNWYSWPTGAGNLKHSMWSSDDLAWSTDDSRLFTAGYDKTFKIWDVASGREISSVSLENFEHSVVLSQRDQFAFIGDFFGGITFLDVVSGRVLGRLDACHSGVLCLAISDDGLSLLLGGWSHEINYWDLSRETKSFDFEHRLALARPTLSLDHPSPEQLRLFGEWYAFCGFPEWGAELLERARSAGATVSSLTLARCYWKMNDFEAASREFTSALERHEAPDAYLRLCLTAVSNKN